MSKVKIVLNKKAVKSLLKSKEMKVCLEAEASKIKARAGKGYGSDSFVGKTRVNVAVYPITEDASKECYENNALLKALK